MGNDSEDHHADSQTYTNSVAIQWYEQQCPHCGSSEWVKIRRSFWQKMLHSNESRCYCLSCRKKFWKEKA